VCVCVCVCVSEWVGGCVCVAFAQYVTSPLTMATDSTSDTGAGHMFRHVRTDRTSPPLFRVF